MFSPFATLHIVTGEKVQYINNQEIIKTVPSMFVPRLKIVCSGAVFQTIAATKVLSDFR